MTDETTTPPEQTPATPTPATLVVSGNGLQSLLIEPTPAPIVNLPPKFSNETLPTVYQPPFEPPVVTPEMQTQMQAAVDHTTAMIKQSAPVATSAETIPPGKIRLVFTKTDWGIPSMIVRWTLPRSRFAWALSSHVLIDTGEYLYEALPYYGVRKSVRSVALAGSTIVDEIDFTVPDVPAALAFLEAQLGKGYDYLGVLGLAFDPNRDWKEDKNWFCYEYAAATLAAGGLDIFSNLSHITETPLLALKASV